MISCYMLSCYMICFILLSSFASILGVCKVTFLVLNCLLPCFHSYKNSCSLVACFLSSYLCKSYNLVWCFLVILFQCILAFCLLCSSFLVSWMFMSWPNKSKLLLRLWEFQSILFAPCPSWLWEFVLIDNNNDSDRTVELEVNNNTGYVSHVGEKSRLM